MSEVALASLTRAVCTRKRGQTGFFLAEGVRVFFVSCKAVLKVLVRCTFLEDALGYANMGPSDPVAGMEVGCLAL